MLTKALPLFALILSFALMAAAPKRSFLPRVIVQAGLLIAIWIPVQLEHGRLVPSVRHADEPWLQALAVIWWMVAARLVVTLTAQFNVGTARRQERLFSDLIKAAIYISAILFVLNSVLQIPIQGLLATSGVIAIVLGLALQNTLADVFSGIAVGIEQPFHVGDEVVISDHAEGTVVQMNWRSVRIQQADDLAVVPNSVVAKGQIINRSRPTPHRSGSVEIPIHTQLAPDRVIELLKQALLLCRGFLGDPAPSVYLVRLGARYLVFKITFTVPTSAVLDDGRSMLLRQVNRLIRFAGAETGTPPDSKTLLAGLALFEGLSDEQLGHLADQGTQRRLMSGETLFKEGDASGPLYVIQSGVLDIVRTVGGESHSLGRIGPGEYIGEVSLLNEQSPEVSAQAITDSRILELPRQAIENLIKADPDLAETLHRSVERGLSRLDRDQAAREAHPKVQSHQLLDRLRTIFNG